MRKNVKPFEIEFIYDRVQHSNVLMVLEQQFTLFNNLRNKQLNISLFFQETKRAMENGKDENSLT